MIFADLYVDTASSQELLTPAQQQRKGAATVRGAVEFWYAVYRAPGPGRFRNAVPQSQVEVHAHDGDDRTWKDKNVESGKAAEGRGVHRILYASGVKKVFSGW
jgi:hypothetical protein